MKKYAVFALLGFTLGTASCERTLEFKGGGPSPKLVIDAIVGPNRGGKPNKYETNDPDLEENTHLFDCKEAVFLFGDRRPGAVNPTVTVRLNGAELPVETANNWSRERVYRYFRTPLAAGDRLDFSAETPEHGRVTAWDVVPRAADITDVKTEWFRDPGDNGGPPSLRTLVSVADPGGEKNYYRFSRFRVTIHYLHHSGNHTEWNPETGEYETEEIINEVSWVEDYAVNTDREILFKRMDHTSLSSTESWGQLSDETFDGRGYTFDLYIEPYLYLLDSRTELLDASVEVEVQTLSETAFKHLRSLDIYDGADTMSEPVRIHTNVEGGYGIFGLYNVARKTVELELPESYK